MPDLGPFGLEGDDLDPELAADLAAGVEQVEALLRDAVKSDYPFVTEASRHLVEAGGKRFRPLMVLLAAQFGDAQAPGVVPAAVVVELTHLATLYHDDVMDEATMRRGGPSANLRWDNTVAILTGDFLFAKASELLADLGPEAVRLQARTFERLCTGQIRETVGAGPDDDRIEHYLSVMADKTGSLIATSGRFGAMLSGADDGTVDVLTRFGERIGIAFQLADDLLDITSEPGQSGKTPGTDLREGIETLPVLHARRLADPASPSDARLLELLDGDLVDDARRDEALRLLRGHPAVDAARAELLRWGSDARSVLDPLPEVPAKHALQALADATVRRVG